MSRIIECHVNDEYILGSGVPIGAAGSFGDVILKLSFNEMWDGLSIVATFKDALGQNERVVMLLPSMLEYGETRTYLVPVPKDAKALAGRAKLTLSGYSTYTIDEDGTKTVKNDSLTNTATAFFRVLESDSAIVDDDSVEAMPAEQVQAELVAFGERMTELEDEMDEWEKDLGEAETEREKTEATRKSNEDKRIEAEGSMEEQKGRVWAEHIRQENEEARLKAEGSADENSEYYGGRALAEKERQDNEEMRKEFYKTAFVGKKSNYVGGGVFNTECDTANDYNLANARAATTFGFDNRIVNNEDDLKATHAHQFFKDDYVPAENKDSNLNESKWGRHSFLAGARNVLTAYSGVGLGQDNKICGYQAVAIGHALRAYSARQLVVGKWNKPDVPPDKDSTAYGDYAFIVGNGNSTDPSNAFAVRWDGEVELSDGKTIEKHIDEAVDSAVAALVGSAPETMNTIGEIAKMIDDPDSAADILGRLAVLDEQMGTVDEALDSIITIQNELIGGEA